MSNHEQNLPSPEVALAEINSVLARLGYATPEAPTPVEQMTSDVEAPAEKPAEANAEEPALLKAEAAIEESTAVLAEAKDDTQVMPAVAAIAPQAKKPTLMERFKNTVKNKKALVLGSLALTAFAGATASANTSNDKPITTTPIEQVKKDRDSKAAEQAKKDAAEAAKENAKNDAQRKSGLNAGSVDRAVKRIQSDNMKEARKNAAALIDAPAKAVSHDKNMQSALKSFDAQSATRYDMYESVAASVRSDLAYREDAYKAIKGIDRYADINVSASEQLKVLKEFLTDEDTYVSNKRLNGLFDNGATVNGETSSSTLMAKNIRAAVIKNADGRTLIVKVGGGNDGADIPCTNIQRELSSSIITESTFVPKKVSEPTPPAPIPGEPTKKTKEKPPKDDEPKKPKKETKKVEEQPKPEKPPTAPEKHDDGKLPGNPNVPADQDKGTPDVAGAAPATPGDSPAHVPRQPQEPTPTPQAPSSETENRPPAETGQGPANVDPNGSANTPGTNNETPKGGSVNPNDL